MHKFSNFSANNIVLSEKNVIFVKRNFNHFGKASFDFLELRQKFLRRKNAAEKDFAKAHLAELFRRVIFRLAQIFHERKREKRAHLPFRKMRKFYVQVKRQFFARILRDLHRVIGGAGVVDSERELRQDLRKRLLLDERDRRARAAQARIDLYDLPFVFVKNQIDLRDSLELQKPCKPFKFARQVLCLEFFQIERTEFY